MARDDFKLNVKNVLAQRVGTRCSNPNCRQVTSGPEANPQKALNIGVAAHITAASKGGPRYDESLSKEERQATDNAIWLCQNHAKLVDDDPLQYSAPLLRHWKRLSEEATLLEIETHQSDKRPRINDLDLVRFYAQCFERPAFQDRFHQEGSIEDFDKAIEDTLTAINTGCLRSRKDGAVLSQSWGKAFLTNTKWHQHMDVIADLLRAIRARYEDAKKNGIIHTNARSDGTEWYCINDRSLADWMDSTRAQILQLFAEVCNEAGVHPPMFPRPRPRW